jgi:hypothetical protein
VILERLRDDEQNRLGVLDQIRICRGDAVLGDDGRAVGPPRVVHEQPPVRAELRVEGEAEQPALAPGEDARRDVEEDRRSRRARL